MIRKISGGLGALLIALLCLAPRSGRAAPIEVTVYGDQANPPLNFVEKGEMKGAYTEVLKVAFSRMDGYKVTIKPEAWATILKKAEAGEIFAFFPPWYRPKERPYIDPYSEPILEEVIRPMCRKSVMTQRERTKWPEDFFGLKIAKTASYSVGDSFDQVIKEGKIKLDEVNGVEHGLLKVAQGAADCYINGDLVILQTIKQLRAKGLITAADEFEFGPSAKRDLGYLGYSKDGKKFPFKDKFVRQFDDVLKKMKNSGELDKIVKKFVEQ